MAATASTALNIVTLQASYLTAEFTNTSKLMASGAVQIDPNPPFKNGGGNFFNVPEFVAFSTTAGQITAAGALTASALTTFYDVGVIVRREVAIGAEDTASYAGGTDVPAEIQRQAGPYWAIQTDKVLYNVLNGAFGSAFASTTNFVYDFQAPFSASCLQGIVNLAAVGDKWPEYKIWIMSSKQWAQAMNNGLVEYVQAGSFGERLLMTGMVPSILGRQVIVDDNLYDTDGTTYLCKPGALYLGYQSDFSVEYYRDALTGGGTDVYALRSHFMPHLRKATFSTSYANATDAQLRTAGYWSVSDSSGTPQRVMAVKVKFTN